MGTSCGRLAAGGTSKGEPRFDVFDPESCVQSLFPSVESVAISQMAQGGDHSLEQHVRIKLPGGMILHDGSIAKTTTDKQLHRLLQRASLVYATLQFCAVDETPVFCVLGRAVEPGWTLCQLARTEELKPAHSLPLACLFASAGGGPWCLRGDPELWRVMHIYFREARTPMPRSTNELCELVASAFCALTGRQLEACQGESRVAGRYMLIPELEGERGISEAMVSLDFWRTTAKQRLCDEWHRRQRGDCVEITVSLFSGARRMSRSLSLTDAPNPEDYTPTWDFRDVRPLVLCVLYRCGLCADLRELVCAHLQGVPAVDSVCWPRGRRDSARSSS